MSEMVMNLWERVPSACVGCPSFCLWVLIGMQVVNPALQCSISEFQSNGHFISENGSNLSFLITESVWVVCVLHRLDPEYSLHWKHLSEIMIDHDVSWLIVTFYDWSFFLLIQNWPTELSNFADFLINIDHKFSNHCFSSSINVFHLTWYDQDKPDQY